MTVSKCIKLRTDTHFGGVLSVRDQEVSNLLLRFLRLLLGVPKKGKTFD